MVSPLKDIPIRIFHKNDTITVFEDYFITNHNGLTDWIPLFIPENTDSYMYEVELNTINKHIIPILLYPNEHTHLQIELEHTTPINQIFLPTRYEYSFHNCFIPIVSDTMKLHSFYMYMQDLFNKNIQPITPKTEVSSKISSFLPTLKNYLISDLSFIHIFHESSLIYFIQTFQTLTKHKLNNLTKNDIQCIQQQLNILSISYPSIPCIQNEYGIWDSDSENALIAFSNIFALPKSKTLTVLHIQRIYEIAFATYVMIYNSLPLPTPLQLHSYGIYVIQLQKNLNFLHNFYTEIPTCTINAHYDTKTMNSILAFQHMFGIKENGIVTKDVWILIQQTLKELK